MTRFVISNQQVVSAVQYAIENHLGGEIFVPKMASYRIIDLATAIAPKMVQQEVGIRPGEKINEELIASAESLNTIDLGEYYAIVPSLSFTGKRSKANYKEHYQAIEVAEDFRYSSNENAQFETVESLRNKIRLYVKKSFII